MEKDCSAQKILRKAQKQKFQNIFFVISMRSKNNKGVVSIIYRVLYVFL